MKISHALAESVRPGWASVAPGRVGSGAWGRIYAYPDGAALEVWTQGSKLRHRLIGAPAPAPAKKAAPKKKRARRKKATG